jgi:hypothetical protein
MELRVHHLPHRVVMVGAPRKKVACILANASGVISPRMRCSFVDGQYSPSTDMDRSEWEKILEELTHMGLPAQWWFLMGRRWSVSILAPPLMRFLHRQSHTLLGRC